VRRSRGGGVPDRSHVAFGRPALLNRIGLATQNYQPVLRRTGRGHGSNEVLGVGEAGVGGEHQRVPRVRTTRAPNSASDSDAKTASIAINSNSASIGVAGEGGGGAGEGGGEPAGRRALG
jgi:hypothetical protein